MSFKKQALCSVKTGGHTKHIPKITVFIQFLSRPSGFPLSREWESGGILQGSHIAYLKKSPQTTF
jgi:hypothetical protein